MKEDLSEDIFSVSWHRQIPKFRETGAFEEEISGQEIIRESSVKSATDIRSLLKQ